MKATGRTMKNYYRTMLMIGTLTFTANAYAFPEIPFCPGGGPPGWVNYFNDKREQNKWRHYSPNYDAIQHRGNMQPTGNHPRYRQPYKNRPLNYRPLFER